MRLARKVEAVHRDHPDVPAGLADEIEGLRLEELAHEFEPPTDACRSWCALYTGAEKLVDDLREHIHLENNVLFPRFEGA